MIFQFTNQTSKKDVFASVKQFLESKGFHILTIDTTRPWGGFFVIDEMQSSKFKQEFFSGIDKHPSAEQGKVSPKILIVESNKRLSWQYHHRRSELWQVIGGTAGIIRSDTDKEGSLETKSVGESLSLKQGERHRLVGLNSWGIIAEIWQHTNPTLPSDEEDIVRVQDDFGR